MVELRSIGPDGAVRTTRSARAAVAVDLAGWLGSLDAEELAQTLVIRPDALVPPRPRSLDELAERLQLPYSTAAVLLSLPKPAVQAAEALAALGSGCHHDDLAVLIGRDADDDDLEGALAVLRQAALAWPDGQLLRTARLRAIWPVPLRLGRPARELLATRPQHELRNAAVAIGAPPTRLKKDTVADLAAWLSEPENVRRLVKSAPRPARELLEQTAWDGPTMGSADAYFPVPKSDPSVWAASRALVVRTDGWGPAEMPREVALALRGTDYHAPFEPTPPPLPIADLGPGAVERQSAAAASAAVRGVGAVLNGCSRQPVATLKSGGVGTRELRRLAKATRESDRDIRLWLELAHAAGLLAVGETAVTPTAAYDRWLALEPADRLVALLAEWQPIPSAVLYAAPGRPPAPALTAPATDGVLAADLRRGLLSAVSALPPGGAAPPVQLGVRVCWDRWLLATNLTDAAGLAAALLIEAELLGLAYGGAGTELARALAGGDRPRLVAAAHRLLPPAESTAHFQADLTAVVTGAPAAALGAVLDLAAHREGRGAASTWRFSPSSVRAALDSGVPAGELLDTLRSLAVRGTLPQPLEYLISDVARRHGSVRVRDVGCCLHGQDPALLAEIAHCRALAPLRLVILAPTVLASARPAAATLAALRAAGYAPVGEDHDGILTVQRQPPSRAPGGPDGAALDGPGGQSSRSPRPARSPADSRATGALGEYPVAGAPPGRHTDPVADLAAFAAGLLRGGPTALTLPVPADGDTAEAITAFAPQLSGAEVRLLAHAIDAGTAICIRYRNAQGATTHRVIEDIVWEGHRLVAWCRLRQEERMFALTRVGSVAPVSA